MRVSWLLFSVGREQLEGRDNCVFSLQKIFAKESAYGREQDIRTIPLTAIHPFSSECPGQMSHSSLLLHAV